MNQKLARERLRQLIDGRNIMQKDFALLCNCSPITLSKILNGKIELSQKMAEKFARTLNVSTEYLSGASDNPNPSSYFLQDQFVSQNLQWRKINKLVEYLKSLEIFFERYLIINNESTLKLGEDMYSEEEIISTLKSDSVHSIEYKVKIKYQDFSKEISSTDFLFVMNNFHRIAQSYFFMLLEVFHDPTVMTVPDEIDKLIQELKTGE